MKTRANTWVVLLAIGTEYVLFSICIHEKRNECCFR